MMRHSGVSETSLFLMLGEYPTIKEEIESVFLAAKLLGYQLTITITQVSKDVGVFLCNLNDGNHQLHFDITFVGNKIKDMCCCKVSDYYQERDLFDDMDVLHKLRNLL